MFCLTRNASLTGAISGRWVRMGKAHAHRPKIRLDAMCLDVNIYDVLSEPKPEKDEPRPKPKKATKKKMFCLTRNASPSWTISVLIMFLYSRLTHQLGRFGLDSLRSIPSMGQRQLL